MYAQHTSQRTAGCIHSNPIRTAVCAATQASSHANARNTIAAPPARLALRAPSNRGLLPGPPTTPAARQWDDEARQKMGPPSCAWSGSERPWKALAGAGGGRDIVFLESGGSPFCGPGPGTPSHHLVSRWGPSSSKISLIWHPFPRFFLLTSGGMNERERETRSCCALC